MDIHIDNEKYYTSFIYHQALKIVFNQLLCYCYNTTAFVITITHLELGLR